MAEEENIYKNRLKSINEKVSAKTNEINNELSSLKGKMESKIQQFGQNVEENESQIIKSIKKSNEETTDKITQDLNQLDQQSTSDIKNMEEDLNTNFANMEEYSKQIIDQEESTLVLTLDTLNSLVTDNLNTQNSNFEKYTKSLQSLGTESTVKSLDLIAAKNDEVNSELKTILELNEEVLSESLVNLKDEFQDAIGSKVEKVFSGVAGTKEAVNEIISDTINHLQSNLARLHSEIDSHFSLEVAELQDTVLSFEGELEGTLKNIIDAYNKQMVHLLDTHLNKTRSTLGEIRGEVEVLKQNLYSNIDSLTEEQSKQIQNTLQIINSQLQNNRKDAIKSFATLRSEIEKLGNENKSLVETQINILSTDFKKILNETKTHYNEQSNLNTQRFISNLKKLTDQAKDLSKSGSKEMNDQFKDIEKILNNLLNSIIKDTRDV